MKKVMCIFALVLSSILIAGCEKPEPEQPKEGIPDIYKGLETPVDRSKSKEY